MKNNSILKISLFAVLLIVFISIFRTSGYISPNLKMPADWRTNAEFLKPQEYFTAYDKSIFIQLSDMQMRAIFSVVSEKAKQDITRQVNITLLMHNLAQTGQLKQIADKLLKARNRRAALKVFDGF